MGPQPEVSCLPCSCTELGYTGGDRHLPCSLGWSTQREALTMRPEGQLLLAIKFITREALDVDQQM